MQICNKSLAVSLRYGQAAPIEIDDIANTNVPATPSYLYIIYAQTTIDVKKFFSADFCPCRHISLRCHQSQISLCILRTEDHSFAHDSGQLRGL